MARSIDIIQKEYGWKDKYVLEEISYKRFKQIVRVLKNRLEKEKDTELVNNLFSTYQTVETIIKVNAGKKYKGRSFKKYLKDLKLDNLIKRNFKITDTERKNQIDKATQNVKDVVDYFKKDN